MQVLQLRIPDDADSPGGSPCLKTGTPAAATRQHQPAAPVFICVLAAYRRTSTTLALSVSSTPLANVCVRVQLSVALFRLMGAVGRSLVVAYTIAWLMFLLVLLLGGFTLFKRESDPALLLLGEVPLQFQRTGGIGRRL